MVVQRNISGALLVAGVVAVSLAGCATPSATGTSGGASSAGAASSAAAAAQSPKQRATADVAAMLRSFVPPPGARQLAAPPAAPGGYLKTPITFLGDATQAHGVTFWEAPGDPQGLIAWEKAHIAKRFTLGDADFGPPAWDQMFQLPAIPGVLTSRDMVMEVVGLGNGKTGLRVDAEVGWQPSRSAADQVPSTAKVVTISELPSYFPHAKRPPKPVTITDAKIVNRLAALLNALPISPVNGIAVPCPMLAVGGLDLTFRASSGGPTLAQAQTDQPCGVTSLTVGARQPLLLNNAVDQQILKIVGLHWTMPKP